MKIHLLYCFSLEQLQIYHFESLELLAGEEFDLNRLEVNILKMVPFEEVEEKGIKKKKWFVYGKGFCFILF